MGHAYRFLLIWGSIIAYYTFWYKVFKSSEGPSDDKIETFILPIVPMLATLLLVIVAYAVWLATK